ncbi:MAG: SLC13 family permease [Prevotellaceae bacterium]|nr:SLC13 family permease [Candidatus Minthosoma equi]
MLSSLLDFQLWGLSGAAWYTILVVLAMFMAMMFTKLRADFAFLVTMTALLIGGVVDVKGAFGGFSSESVLTVAILYVVIAGLTYTGVLNWIVKNLMGVPRTLSGAITRLMVPVAFLSSLLSNTTVVALFVNVVNIWSRKLGIAPSKLLIPLSYASGMGGICTLIGTPPNLIISGLYTEQTGIQLSILTPTLCGLFCLAVGVISMIAMQKLLPTRESPMNDVNIDDFTAELTVPSDNAYIGMTIAEAEADLNKTVYEEVKVIAIRRYDKEVVSPVNEDEFIMGGDRIIMSGKAKSIHEICHKFRLSCPSLDGVLENEVDDSAIGVKTVVSSAIMIVMVVLSALKIVPIVESCLLAALAMVICRCCSIGQAMKSIDWNILIVFAGSVCIGKSIESTGIAEIIANGLLDVCGTNPYVILTVMCLVATFATEFISNTAAGAMFYPIAMSSAAALNVNPLTFCVALMIAASSSFATPIGSPTHMLVYGPGGYRFSDFAKVGVLMNLIILAANVFISTIVFPL